MIIVLRAGGVGSRLWPVSREQQPKQFHTLTGGKTLLQESLDRVEPLVSPKELYLSVNADTAEMVKISYPQILPENIIVEPARRDTAAGIGLESILIRKRHPDAIIASLGSDHSVQRVKEFQRVLKRAEDFVHSSPEYILAVGVHPTRPETGYGYIHYSTILEDHDELPVWRVHHFSEKPSAREATALLAEGNVLWNANMFVWHVQTILDLYKQHLPTLYAELCEIEADLGTPAEQTTLTRVYPQMEKIAVDYGIIEKAEKIAVLPADIGWSDIGDWARLKDELAHSEKENVVLGAQHIGMDTVNSLVYGTNAKKVITTIGVENLVIVDTHDALLICDKYHSDRVKELVEHMRKSGKGDVL